MTDRDKLALMARALFDIEEIIDDAPKGKDLSVILKDVWKVVIQDPLRTAVIDTLNSQASAHSPSRDG